MMDDDVFRGYKTYGVTVSHPNQFVWKTTRLGRSAEEALKTLVSHMSITLHWYSDYMHVYLENYEASLILHQVSYRRIKEAVAALSGRSPEELSQYRYLAIQEVPLGAEPTMHFAVRGYRYEVPQGDLIWIDKIAFLRELGVSITLSAPGEDPLTLDQAAELVVKWGRPKTTKPVAAFAAAIAEVGQALAAQSGNSARDHVAEAWTWLPTKHKSRAVGQVPPGTPRLADALRELLAAHDQAEFAAVNRRKREQPVRDAANRAKRDHLDAACGILRAWWDAQGGEPA